MTFVSVHVNKYPIAMVKYTRIVDTESAYNKYCLAGNVPLSQHTYVRKHFHPDTVSKC